MMAGSVNKVIIVGNLGRDPEVRSFANGGKVVNLRIATSETWRDKASGERKERTEWHNITISGDGLVGVVERYLKKGSKVYIEGSLRTRKYTDKDGVEKYTTEIRGDSMQMLGSRQGGGDSQMDEGEGHRPPPQQRPTQQSASRTTPKPAPNFSDMDDEIPFNMEWR